MKKKPNKYLDCPPNELGYEIDCPLKKALKRLFNDYPGNYALGNVKLSDKIPQVDPGHTFDTFTKIRLDIELVAEYYFDLNGKLRKCR